MNNAVLTAFLLTLLAGLSTGIGSTVAFLCKNTNRKFFSASLGFSAGVMIYVSMIEIFANAEGELTTQYGARTGNLIATVSFFAGILIAAVIDRIVPNGEKRSNVNKQEDKNNNTDKLMRTGFVTALVIALHNFPEGLATFISALQMPSVALSVTMAIAIHNIPEGIAVSVPIYQATGSKKKALMYSFMSGLAEPLGAVLGYFILAPFITQTVFGVLFAAVAGIMVFISFNELLPTANKFGGHKLTVCGMIIGMAVMAVSLLLFM